MERKEGSGAVDPARAGAARRRAAPVYGGDLRRTLERLCDNRRSAFDMRNAEQLKFQPFAATL